jgi:hypothetical protein
MKEAGPSMPLNRLESLNLPTSISNLDAVSANARDAFCVLFAANVVFRALSATLEMLSASIERPQMFEPAVGLILGQNVVLPGWCAGSVLGPLSSDLN